MFQDLRETGPMSLLSKAFTSETIWKLNWAQIRPVRDCGVTGGRGRQTFKNGARESQLSRRVNVIASGINRFNLYLEKNRQKLL